MKEQNVDTKIAYTNQFKNYRLKQTIQHQYQSDVKFRLKKKNILKINSKRI